MALYEDIAGDMTLPASGDLSTKQHYLVKLDTNGQIAVASTAGDVVIGVLMSKPSVQGQAASVKRINGEKGVVLAGGNIAKGDLLKTDATGKAATASKATVNTSDAGAAGDPVIGSYVFGVALESAVSGDIFQALLLPIGSVATTAA